jgi:hypothetical protein
MHTIRAVRLPPHACFWLKFLKLYFDERSRVEYEKAEKARSHIQIQVKT